jgi:hypothetical protein
LSTKSRWRITRDCEKGATLAAIANRLNDEGVPTAQGGRWHPSTVRKIVATSGSSER